MLFSLVVTRSQWYSLVVTRGHSCSLVVTRGYSWSFVVTPGHSYVLLDTRSSIKRGSHEDCYPSLDAVEI